jgi:hypothetical protein
MCNSVDICLVLFSIAKSPIKNQRNSVYGSISTAIRHTLEVIIHFGGTLVPGTVPLGTRVPGTSTCFTTTP